MVTVVYTPEQAKLVMNLLENHKAMLGVNTSATEDTLEVLGQARAQGDGDVPDVDQ